MKDVFQKDFDIERVLMAIQLVTGVVVDTDTLIIFDELQEASRGLTALKYFQEKAPQYHVVAAGSLLVATPIFQLPFQSVSLGWGK